MYSDKNLVNRRNLKKDVTTAANACRRFFILEVEARIVAATLHVLGMKKIDDLEPTTSTCKLSSNATVEDKKIYLNKVSALVVDQFVVDQKRNLDVEKSVKKMQSDLQTDFYGRYPCRYLGCSKTFASPGKLRKDHEEKHEPPVPDESQGANILKSTLSHEDDDMLCYQRSLLDYGMLVLNFLDGISEGDGERVVRCWKFFLMYLKHHGRSSKYALEALYLMFQINVLLSPQEAHRLVWNRFVKNKSGIGGNIPLDLQLEFFNKLVKVAIKNQGSGASQNSINRICHSLGITSSLMTNFDRTMAVYKRAGKHVKRSTQGDLEKIVNELMIHKAFTCTPGRRYKYFTNVSSSLLTGFDMKKMFSWISAHKKFMILNRKAR